MKEEEKKNKFKITQIITNKRYRAIANLIFYPTLILILIIYSRSLPAEKQSVNKNETIETKDIFTKNFNFRYSLKEDDKNTVYEGKQYLDKILFNDITNSKKYYIQKNVVLEENEGKYILSKNPTKYFNYLDIDLISSIISNSNKDKNDYVIKMSRLLDILKINSQVDDSDSELVIEVIESKGSISKLTIDLSEFVEIVYKKEIDVVLQLEYKDIGTIEDFNVN